MYFPIEFFQKNFVDFLFASLPPVVELLALIFKLLVLSFIYRRAFPLIKNTSIFYIILILLADVFTNITLICYYFAQDPFVFISKQVCDSLTRMEFVTGTVQRYALVCFFRELSSKKISNNYIRSFLPMVLFLVVYFFTASVSTFFCGKVLSEEIHCYVLWIDSFYVLGITLFALFLICRNAKVEPLKILKKHIMTLGLYFMTPYFCFKIVESNFFSMKTNFMVAPITSGLLTFLIYYCARKLMVLRFLNMQSHVASHVSGKFSFVDDFKDTLGALSAVSNVYQLIPITKEFFSKAFNIPKDKVSIYFRGVYPGHVHLEDDEREEEVRVLIEKRVSSSRGVQELVDFLKRDKIVIRDEVEFTQFYNNGSGGENLSLVISFLKELKADIFIPIFSADKIVASIVIAESARAGEFYTDVERDEMLIYSDYIGRVVHLLVNTNLEGLLMREREVRLESNRKERIISLLKGTMAPFLNTNKMRKIGVLTYKARKFVCANKAVRDLIGIDLNVDRGLDFTRRLTELGDDVTQTGAAKRLMLPMPRGEVVIVNASPNLVRGNVVMTISNPSISDLTKDLMPLLKDETKWDYLLALQVTQEGGYINQLLPADTVTFLNIKISFFECVVTRSNLLFEMPSEHDVRAFAHVAHKISGRRILEEIRIERLANDERLAEKLFGLNPAFEGRQEPHVFERLHKYGTLVLYNIHLLSLELQKRLLEYIISGKYTLLKSDEQREADILLICATSQNLVEFVEKGAFLRELYLELRKSALWLPSLINVAEDDLLALAEGFRCQVVFAKVYQNLLQFNEGDKSRIISSGCVSIDELKAKVQSIILKKTRKQSLSEAAVLDPAYSVSDLDLVEAARLGKQAIKDPKVLAMLMRKFDFNQSKVAQFLGMNRSTVSRRCAEYTIDKETNSMTRSKIV